ncbi:MAG: hypothetical protein ACRDAM_18285, partial [Casimicrobium sp.]
RRLESRGPQSGTSARPAPPAPPLSRTDEVDWRAAGAGQDASFERSNFLSDTFYKNADALLQQVERSGAMGVNRGWEAGARKGGDWYIEEQRFGDTVIGAGVNRNRVDLIDAGLRAFEWGFQQQAQDGSFPCKDNYVSTAYFVAGVAHSIWLLESTGFARDFSGRIATMRPKLMAAARWLGNADHIAGAKTSMDQFVSRYFLTGYALGASARVVGEPALAYSGEALIREGLAKQNAAGFFPEKSGFDVSFQGEALVYLLRYHDHVATTAARRANEPAIARAVAWLETRVNANGVIQAANNTRSGAGQERDRTGQPRRVSAVAVARAFGLARYVLGDAKYEALAQRVASARQTG